MSEKVFAATLVSPGQFEVREYETPDIPPDAGLLQVEAAGICGSDLSGYQRMGSGPRIMGHENVGFIAKIGSEASKRWGVKVGDRVTLEEYLPCGACVWCRTGDYRFCGQTDIGQGGVRLWYGAVPVSVWPSLWGGFGQYLYLHPNAVVHRVPAHVPATEAAMAIPLSNGIEWVCNYGGLGLGQTVAIQGPGQQGLACVIAAKEAGAACIIVSGLSRDAKRLEVARKLGADYTVDVEKQDLRQRVSEITGGHGVDVVVNVSAGGKGTVAEAFDIAHKRCTIVLAGAGDQQISTGGLGRKNIVMKWAHGHSFGSVELVIQIIASGKYPLSELATHQFGLSQVKEAIKTVGTSEGIHVSVFPRP